MQGTLATDFIYIKKKSITSNAINNFEFGTVIGRFRSDDVANMAMKRLRDFDTVGAQHHICHNCDIFQSLICF